MKINILTQNFMDGAILYAPKLELPGSPNVVEKCYPAVRTSLHYPEAAEYFYILISELGNYEENSKHSNKGFYYETLGGKTEIEKRFWEMT